jgi:DNA adenine methylase
MDSSLIKSPLRYPGGKSRAIDLIASISPQFDEFREPFVGGGSLYVYFKQKYPTKRYWINDLYYPLFKFWEMTQRDVNGLIDQVWNWKDEYKTGKELYRYLLDNLDSFDDIKRAAAFFVFNRITFSGTTESGGYSEGSFKGRFTDSSIDRLRKLGKIVHNTMITNLDYEKVVNTDGKNVFIFLDPPYHSATKSALYGKNGNLHKSFDHERFAETMKKCKHKWLITYDDSPFIRDLFSFANIKSWNLTYGMRNQTPTSNQIGEELFVSNYELKIAREEQLMLISEPKAKYKRKGK